MEYLLPFVSPLVVADGIGSDGEEEESRASRQGRSQEHKGRFHFRNPLSDQ